jgi:hypothetical protein
MCYLVHQQSPQAAGGADAKPAVTEYTRPRWVAAAGYAIMGAFALTTFMIATSARPLRDSGAAAHVAPVTTQAAPPMAKAQKASLPADDDVPTAPVSVRASAHDCHHGL